MFQPLVKNMKTSLVSKRKHQSFKMQDWKLVGDDVTVTSSIFYSLYAVSPLKFGILIWKAVGQHPITAIVASGKDSQRVNQ